MLIPQSMAYAELAGVPPELGFYAVIGALVIYALVGTSRHLGVGPEPGTAILAATGVGAIAAGDAERYLALMAALALLVAAVCIGAALLRLGFLASVLWKPVLVGYITGVGLTLLSSQIAGMTGLSISSDTFLSRFGELAREVGDVHGKTLALGVATLLLGPSQRPGAGPPRPCRAARPAGCAASSRPSTARCGATESSSAGTPVPRRTDRQGAGQRLAAHRGQNCASCSAGPGLRACAPRSSRGGQPSALAPDASW
jgi:hypothetical protein